MRIFGDLGSGNCLKVKWTADALGRSYTWMPVNIMKGEARTAEFAKINPALQTPTVDFGNGRFLAQSNAIIRYLARGSRLLPDDAWTQAKIDEWLFWEQYSHEPNIATCRFHMHPSYLGKSKESRDPVKVERGEKALDLMEQHLATRSYLVGDTLSIADIALLAYTRLAHEGGFDLADRLQIRKWIATCEQGLKIT